ncbi:hypothetical protein [Suttonella ornithocola]|uniref:Uncharacterized protein n=1 Tax=Suttonella ornithocola TaxID=279832 RepID=A0A380MX67_9GAMM|nr:hypothetical protein [Suttonella ornithocola]SUO96774.1 Uncharacterised protein [Suttonella ornithocola]
MPNYFMQTYCTNESVLDCLANYHQFIPVSVSQLRLSYWQQRQFGAEIIYCDRIREKNGGTRVDMESIHALPLGLFRFISKQFPDKRIELFFARENDDGCYCGVYHFCSGECSENLIQPYTKVARMLSAYLLDHEPYSLSA